jgi:hypothetical protein
MLAGGVLDAEVLLPPSPAAALVPAQYLVKHPPRLQPGNMPLAPLAGSQTDRVDILWQTVPVADGTGDSFTVEYRRANPSEAWQPARANDPTDTGQDGRVVHSATLEGLTYDADYEYRGNKGEAPL